MITGSKMVVTRDNSGAFRSARYTVEFSNGQKIKITGVEAAIFSLILGGRTWQPDREPRTPVKNNPMNYFSD